MRTVERQAAPGSDPFARRAALMVVGTGSYMSAMGGSIVNSTLPVITRAFGAEVAQMEWVITVFLLVQGGLLLGFGRLGDLKGHRPVYLIGLTIFVAGAVLCALAPTREILIGARAIQALGGSMQFAASPAILTHVFPPAQRGRAMGFYATAVYLGLASGPPLGGWLAEALEWRAVFYANLPFGLLALAVGLRFLPADRPTARGERFDFLGAAVYVLSVISLLLGLNQGHAWGWTSPGVLGCLVSGVLLAGLFVVVERRSTSPMIDLSLFGRRAFSAPVLAAMLNYMCTSSTFFLMPFYLIQGRGLGTAQAGLILASQPIVMATVASFSGALSDRIGVRLPATIGMSVLSLGLFFLSRLSESAPLIAVSGALALVGLGVGLFTSPNTSSIMGAVPAQRRGVAGGVTATARTLGNVLGVGLAGALFSTVLAESGLLDPEAVVRGAHLGLGVACGLALLGTLASASRPAQQ
jgi:EmrB/QacA subfamily drug resistance transporter